MRMKMKRVFRRNQIIITTLAIMIAAAGYLNYAGKSDLPGADTYEAGATKISDSDIYSENQAVSGSVADGEYEEIASLDDPGEGDPLAAGSEEGTAQGAADGEEASADNPAVDNPGEAVLTGGTGVAEYPYRPPDPAALSSTVSSAVCLTSHTPLSFVTHIPASSYRPHRDPDTCAALPPACRTAAP